MLKALARALIAAAILFSPAHAAGRLSPYRLNEYAGVHTIGIVWTMDNVFRIRRAGVTRFGNAEQTYPIENWHLDDLLTGLVATALASKYTVVPVAYDHDKLINCTDYEACVALLPPNPAIDAYIFIATGLPTQAYGDDQSWVLKGFGLFRSELMFTDDVNDVHALYEVHIVDAKTGREIDSGLSRLSKPNPFNDEYPTTRMKPAPLPNADSQLPEGELEKLHPLVVDLIERSYMYALTDAHLLPANAAPTSPAQK